MEPNYKRWNPFRNLVGMAMVMYAGKYMTNKYPDPKERWIQSYRFVRNQDTNGLYDTADGWSVNEDGRLLVGQRAQY